MAWTYSADPATSELDKYRFIVGDTDEAEQIMQNAELQYILDTTSDENKRLHQLFRTASLRFARIANKRTLGPMSEETTERIKFYREQTVIYARKAKSQGLSLPTDASDVFTKGMNANV